MTKKAAKKAPKKSEPAPRKAARKAAKRVTKAAPEKASKATSQKSDKPVLPAATKSQNNDIRANLKALRPKQARFVAEYLANGMNATKAAIAAGYSAKTAQEQGSRLLSNVMVAEAVAAATAKVMDELDYSIERTLREVAKLAYFDPLDLFNDDGTFKILKDIPVNARAVIAGMETEEESFPGLGGDSEDAEPIVRPMRVITKKLKLTDRRGALDMLMRYHSLYRDKSEVKHVLDYEDLSDEELEAELAKRGVKPQ